MVMGIPVIRLTLEGMKGSILKAFSELELQLDEDIRAAVEAYCTPENVAAIINREVQTAIDAAVKQEVDNFYRYGEGRQIIRKVIQERLDGRRI